jgi:hypothetical protein
VTGSTKVLCRLGKKRLRQNIKFFLKKIKGNAGSEVESGPGLDTLLGKDYAPSGLSIPLKMTISIYY